MLDLANSLKKSFILSRFHGSFMQKMPSRLIYTLLEEIIVVKNLLAIINNIFDHIGLSSLLNTWGKTFIHDLECLGQFGMAYSL